MNNNRRKAIAELWNRIETIIDTSKADLESIKDELIALKEDEQEYLDNMPESLRDGERAEIAEAAIENLESAEQSLDASLSELETLKEIESVLEEAQA